MLRIALPDGPLRSAVIEAFEASDMPLQLADSHQGSAAHGDISSVRFLRPQEIPDLLTDGTFDVGLTTRAWVEETGADVVEIAALPSLRSPAADQRLVLAAHVSSPWTTSEQLPRPFRVATEFPSFAHRALTRLGLSPIIRVSFAATESKVPALADALVISVGVSSNAGLRDIRVLRPLMRSPAVVVASRAVADASTKRTAIMQIADMLRAATAAYNTVMLKFTVEGDGLDRVIDLLPRDRRPAVSPLHSGELAVETVVPKTGLSVLITDLMDAGAHEILELPLTKVVP